MIDNAEAAAIAAAGERCNNEDLVCPLLVDPPDLPWLGKESPEDVETMKNFLEGVVEKADAVYKAAQQRENKGEKVKPEEFYDLGALPHPELLLAPLAKDRVSCGACQANQGTRGSVWKQEMMQRMRDSYRCTWGLPHIRALLRSAPHLMMNYTPEDLDRGLERFQAPEAVGNLASHVNKLREMSKTMWRDYQHSLEVDQAKSGQGEDSAADASGTKEKAGKKLDRCSLKRFGGVGVMTIDAWASAVWYLDNRKKPKQGTLMTTKQDKMLRKALSNSSISALVLCCGVPFVAEPLVHAQAPQLTPEEQLQKDKENRKALKELKKLAKLDKSAAYEYAKAQESLARPEIIMTPLDKVSVMSPFYAETRPMFQWSYHSLELQYMLEKLFDWMAATEEEARKR
ncbi:unnamed protein product, partial [Chrysoparadoxa australica]